MPKAHRHLFLAACSGMIVYGMILALPGTVIGFPAFTGRFGLSLADRGVFIAALFASLFAGSLVSGAIVDYAGYRRAIAGSAALLALILPVFAVAASYPVAVAALAGLGLASAPLNTAANALSSELFPSERGRRLTQLSIAFSVGGMLMPAAAAATAGSVSWRAVVIGTALLAGATAAGAATTPMIAAPPRDAVISSAVSFFGRRGFFLFCTLLICGAANEGSFAGWTSSYLSSAGVGTVLATFGLASHWLGLLLSRTFFASRVDRGKRVAIMRGALAGAAILFAMLVLPSPAVLAVGPFAAGAAIAVIVPTSLALAGDRFPGNPGMLFGVLLTMAQVGGMTLPALIGTIAGVAGLHRALGLAVINGLVIATIAWRAGRSRA